MTITPYDDLEKHKDKIRKLRGSLCRELLRAISFRTEETFPEATHLHIVQYPDNVYRVWAVAAGKRWVAVCEDNVAPTWTSINLDADIDLVVRLDWNPKITKYTRKDGVEVFSLDIRSTARTRRLNHGRPQAGHVDEGEAPSAQDGGPTQEHGRGVGQAREAVGQHQARPAGDQP